MNEITCWRFLLDEAMASNGESWACVESFAIETQEGRTPDEELVRLFDPGFGGHEGAAFTVWTKARVYFPVVYDGAEWVESVSRHPDGKPTGHFGGE
jgi:hypothetical protein